MIVKTASFAFAAACLTAIATVPVHAAGTYGNYGPQSYQGAPPQSGGATVVTNGPQGTPPADWSARQNVIDSQRYDRLVRTNRAFREARMRKECGPITDAQLHQSCLASFGQAEPYVGSSTPPTGYGSSSSYGTDYDSSSTQYGPPAARHTGPHRTDVGDTYQGWR